MNRDDQVLKNLDLAERFLGEILDRPSVLDDIPDDGVIVLVPEGSAQLSELADANVHTARDLLSRRSTGGQTTQPVEQEADAAPGVLLRASRQ
jgi:hypothetical protein